ncbi:PREDICTED: protein FAR1-RELATED SEQUENCE 9-like, partial [Nelumbo nucifera]|uniref:Protein FAR1-RELATED SEQUENCE n=1 Tax=Nelumbo nucifera TaxID=4432 RepID=A0A1U7Z9A8_NELNU
MFVGVNNYMQSTIFGVALLYDETAETFEWLFKTFIKTMGGKQPKTILTDDDAAMEKAINLVLPEINHQLYEFEDAWEKMVKRYNLQENDWLQKLYDKRHKWALVFGRQTFSTGISTTQRSESVNSCLKKHHKIKHDLSRLLWHFERVVADRRYEELKAEFAATQGIPALTTSVDILNYFSRIYTPPIFSLFFNEVMQQLNCSIEEDYVVCGTSTKYVVSVSGKSRRHTVTFDSVDDLVNCSCKNIEYMGILCGHALKEYGDGGSKKHVPPKKTKRTRAQQSNQPLSSIQESGFEKNNENVTMRNQQNIVSHHIHIGLENGHAHTVPLLLQPQNIFTYGHMNSFANDPSMSQLLQISATAFREFRTSGSYTSQELKGKEIKEYKRYLDNSF